MKKVQDHYFKRAKKEKFPARSVYKLEEAHLKHRLLKQGQRVLDLGCHPGSWCLYAASVVGARGTVVGVDLQKTEIAGQKENAEIHLLCYDVHADGLIADLRKQWPGFHVLLSDMAPKTTGSTYADHQQSLRLVRRVVEIAAGLLHENGTLYCKVFQGEDLPELISGIRPLFETLKLVKPQSSRGESREVFLLGRKFRPRSARLWCKENMEGALSSDGRGAVE